MSIDDRYDLVNSSFQQVREEITEDGGWHEFIVGTYPQLDREFELPGRGSVYRESCGSVRKVKRCKETNKISVLHNYCYKADCPICYNAWAQRNAANMVKKIIALHRVAPFFHWSVSFENQNLEEMKNIVRDIFPDCFCFFHPYRLQDENGVSIHESECDKTTLRWVKGPHFHVLSTIEYHKTAELFERTRVVVHRIAKIENTVDDFSRLINYELSHVALRKTTRRGNLTAQKFAFGKFSNSKINRLLYALPVSEVNVKCSCSECSKRAFYEDRSDTFISDLRNSIVDTTRKNNAFCVRTNFEIAGFFSTYRHKDTIFFPRSMLWNKQQLVVYLRRLGVQRYIDVNEIFNRVYQQQIDKPIPAGILVEGPGVKRPASHSTKPYGLEKPKIILEKKAPRLSMYKRKFIYLQ